MSCPPDASRTPASPTRRLPFLLTSAAARVGLAIGVSAALWAMTGWAMGWLW